MSAPGAPTSGRSPYAEDARKLDAPVVILGGGPAGASAALWCRSMGLRVILLESGERTGGQLHIIKQPLQHVAGLHGVPGVELARTLGEQLAAAAVEVRCGQLATLDAHTLRVRCAPHGGSINAGAVVIATGARWSTLGVPGGQEEPASMRSEPRPNTEGIPVVTDARGFVVVDKLQRTSVPFVWAVGDVCSPEAPTLCTALGHGAVAARSIHATLSALTPATPAPRATGPDRLRIEGLTFPARIGVYPQERRRTQTLTFAVEFDVNAASAAPTDSVNLTLDYASVAATLGSILSARHFNLIETVAQTAAETLLKRFPTRRVWIRVQKPGVPQAGATASIEIERLR